MPEIVISDTSCLIVLSNIGQLDLLRQRYSRIFIPPEVEQEFGSPLPEWIFISEPSAPSFDRVRPYKIDVGEKAAIALALDHAGCTLIADDEKARRLAERFQITLTGTLGFLVKAKKAGLLPAIKPLIDQIMQTDFYMSASLIHQALRDAGELPPAS